MKRLIFGLFFFGFIVQLTVLGVYAQPGYRPRPASEDNKQEWQLQRQRDQWKSMQRQDERYREESRERLQDSFDKIDRDMERIRR